MERHLPFGLKSDQDTLSLLLEAVTDALKLRGGPMADALLPRISAGEVLTCLAYLKPARRNAADPVTTIAVPSPDGFVVNGTKVGVLGLGLADYVVFSAIVPDLGTTLFCIETSRPGLEAASHATLDGGEAADIDLRDVQVARDHIIGPVGGGQPTLDRLIDESTAALCAAACGTRHIAAEQAASLSQLAFAKLDAPEAERQEAVSGAKYLVAEARRVVSQGAVQLLGGIGTTEELAIGRFFKRALMLEHLVGGASYHLDRYRLAQPWALKHDAPAAEPAEAVCP